MFQYPSNIFDAVRQERQDFLNNHIEIVDGLDFSQYSTIKKIHKYYTSHYESGDYETINGIKWKKPFFNINKWRCDVSTKMLDIDVKDFLLISNNPATDFNVYLLEKEVKAWLKRHKLGKVLNQVVRNLPIYGSVVLRKVKDGAEPIDLRFLMNDQAAESLKQSRYVIIKHLLSPGALRKMRGKWENVDEVIDKHCSFVSKSYEDSQEFNQAVGSPYAEIYERFAEVPLSWFTDKQADENDFVLARFIVAGVDSYTTDSENRTTQENGLVLFKEQISELPFKEVHYNRVEGRWLGVGVVEDTFEDQRMVNKVKISEAKALELSSLILYQTEDQAVAGLNLLAEVENGDFIFTRSPITRLDNEMRALPEFVKISESYELHADRMTFSHDVIRGEAAPATATLGAVEIQAGQAISVFDYKKENIGLFLQEFFDDLVFPELAKKIKMPHVFRFSGSIDELEKMRRKAVEGYLRTKILETGIVPTKEEYEAAVQELVTRYRELGDKVWVQTVEDFMSNLDYEMSLEITGEGRNVRAQLANVSALLQMFGKNPTLLQNPLLKRLLFKVMALMGTSISELEMAEQELNQQQTTQLTPQSNVPALQPTT